MVEIDNHREGLPLENQLAIVKEAYPLVWHYIQSLEEQVRGDADLPKFDDDDEIIEPRSEGIEPRKNKEAYYDEGFS